MVKLAATMKNPTSLTKVFFPTLNSLTNAIDPATTAVMNPAAPINSPTARLPLWEFIAAKVEKTSGLPFPNANNVTPAMLSLMPSNDAIAERFMPIELLGRKSQNLHVNNHTYRRNRSPQCRWL
jgi:hypothetical protein